MSSRYFCLLAGYVICFLVNRGTLSELKNELKLYALAVATINLSGIQTHISLRTSYTFEPLRRTYYQWSH